MDNNVAQVVLVEDINPGSSNGYINSSNPSDLEELNGKLYFGAGDGETGGELWVSDGTAQGTELVADINPGSSDYYFNQSSPDNLTELNGKLYFGADDGETGRELWVTDGTTEGTKLVANINPGSTDSLVINFDLAELNGRLYFSADDGEIGRELWVTDGTTEGTNLVADIDSNSLYGGYSSYPVEFTEFDGKLYFAANDGETGSELWVTDGTTEGTKLVADINSGISYGYFIDSFPSDLTEFNGKLYFAADDSETGSELWVTDGTTEGTKLVADINSGTDSYSGYPYGSKPGEFTEFDGKLYFAADDGETGGELWVTDGTSEGTKLFADINPGSGGSNLGGFTEFDGKLYFAADDGETGRELWVTDGTSEGTKLVEDTNLGSAGSNPSYLTVVDNELFFAADNGEVGTELFKLTFDGDGTSKLIGTDGDDNLVGTPEDNTIDGLAGKDSINGGDGNDSIVGGSGRDSLDGQNGNDTILGGDSIDLIFGGDGEDSLVGELGNDTIEGGSGNDVILGDRGFDNLVGGDGDDTISGGRDRDTIDGGLGDDVLTGGFGEDVFVLRVGDGADLITDFQADRDRIGLAGGLQYEALIFEGENILSGDELLATVEGLDTQQIGVDSFEII